MDAKEKLVCILWHRALGQHVDGRLQDLSDVQMVTGDDTLTLSYKLR